MPALRIASLLSSATEILYALGLGERVVAVSHECDFPADAVTKPRATRSRIDSLAGAGAIDRQVQALMAAGEPLYEIDGGLLCELRPDLIVTQAQCDVCAVRFADVVDLVKREPALAHTQIVSLSPNLLADVFDDILRVGIAAGCEPLVRRYVAGLQDRVEGVRRRACTLPSGARPRVACIEWIEPLMLAANWTPELIALAGGECPLAKAGQHSTYAAWDDVLQLDPQVLVIAPCGFDLERTMAEARTLISQPGFSQLAAVRSGRAWCIDGSAYLNRSGPRLVDSLELLAHLLHPDLFPAPGWSAGTRVPWQRWKAV